MLIVLTIPMLFQASFCTIHHNKQGTVYDDHAIDAYVEENHGPDGKLFLDPYFSSEIASLDGCKVLDAGCGAGNWAAYAAAHSGEVYALDIQDKMISAAENLLKKNGYINRVKLVKGDVADLPFEDLFFDKVISICLASNLPEESFKRHFFEFQRTLKDNGLLVTGAPSSLDTVFSNDSKKNAQVCLQIYQVLSALPNNPKSDLIIENLKTLTEVMSATFYMKENRLALLTNEQDIRPGTPIWRKLPNMVIPNYFWSKNNYICALEEAGFDIVQCLEPHFGSEKERLEHNKNVSADKRLGQSYVTDGPFVTIKAKKRPIPK